MKYSLRQWALLYYTHIEWTDGDPKGFWKEYGPTVIYHPEEGSEPFNELFKFITGIEHTLLGGVVPDSAAPSVVQASNTAYPPPLLRRMDHIQDTAPLTQVFLFQFNSPSYQPVLPRFYMSLSALFHHHGILDGGVAHMFLWCMNSGQSSSVVIVLTVSRYPLRQVWPFLECVHRMAIQNMSRYRELTPNLPSHREPGYPPKPDLIIDYEACLRGSARIREKVQDLEGLRWVLFLMPTVLKPATCK